MKYPTLYRTIQIDGPSICYREAGPSLVQLYKAMGGGWK
jgi:hypothetical protein